MSTKQTVNRSVVTLAVLGSLVLVNLIGLKLFRRLDLTEDRQFSLSSATISTLQGLTDPLTIRAYFTSDLPPPYSAHARYVRDLLEEYYARSSGKVRYEFVDPEAAETDEDKEKKKDVKHDIFGRPVRAQTSVERDLDALGIQPVQMQVNQGDKVEVKRAYMGIAVSYGGKAGSDPRRAGHGRPRVRPDDDRSQARLHVEAEDRHAERPRQPRSRERARPLDGPATPALRRRHARPRDGERGAGRCDRAARRRAAHGAVGRRAESYRRVRG
jgi:hypothetical protein